MTHDIWVFSLYRHTGFLLILYNVYAMNKFLLNFMIFSQDPFILERYGYKKFKKCEWISVRRLYYYFISLISGFLINELFQDELELTDEEQFYDDADN